MMQTNVIQKQLEDGRVAIVKDGSSIHPDGWPQFTYISDCDDFKDSGFPGCQFRIRSDQGYDLAVNLRITSRKSTWVDFYTFKFRVEIEFVGDCKESTFHHGWVYCKR